MLAPKRRVKEVIAPVAPQPAVTTAATVPLGSNTEKLKLAKMLASRINMAKNLGPEAKVVTQQAAEAILKGEISSQQTISVNVSFWSTLNYNCVSQVFNIEMMF